MTSDRQIDLNRLAVIQECMETYGMEKKAPNSEWPWNVISTLAVTYSCGAIGRRGDVLEHDRDPSELKLCIDLAEEAANIMRGVFIGMGDEGDHEFSPFYITAAPGITAPKIITEEFIRKAFGGTIYPPAPITIEPLEEKGQWWSYISETDPETQESWQKLIAWFKNSSKLHSPSFVAIGEDPLDDDSQNGGCVFPRLAVGLTRAGSLVGVFSCVVHT